MSEPSDPLAPQRKFWHRYGDFVVRSLSASKAEVDGVHRDLQASALSLKVTNPKLIARRKEALEIWLQGTVQ